MVTDKTAPSNPAPGDHVRVNWAGVDAEALVVDVYSSVVGQRVVVDILWGGDASPEEPTRMAVPLDKISSLTAA